MQQSTCQILSDNLYSVYIIHSRNGVFICGSTVITPQWIITAGDKLNSSDPSALKYSNKPSAYEYYCNSSALKYSSKLLVLSTKIEVTPVLTNIPIN